MNKSEYTEYFDKYRITAFGLISERHPDAVGTGRVYSWLRDDPAGRELLKKDQELSDRLYELEAAGDLEGFKETTIAFFRNYIARYKAFNEYLKRPGLEDEKTSEPETKTRTPPEPQQPKLI